VYFLIISSGYFLVLRLLGLQTNLLAILVLGTIYFGGLNYLFVCIGAYFIKAWKQRKNLSPEKRQQMFVQAVATLAIIVGLLGLSYLLDIFL
jgi:hypothetical protein